MSEGQRSGGTSGTMPVRAGYQPIPGLCPISRQTVDFLLSIEYFGEVQRHQPHWKVMAAASLGEILGNPAVVFQDLRREGYSDAYCYSGVPSEYHRKDRVTTPFPNGFVLVVFAAWDKRGHLILDWDKRKADPGCHGFPLKWAEDFGEPAWTRD